jgi:hypothetical protein
MLTAVKAIVTAIDDPWREEIATIWGELRAVFGLGSLTGALRPYLTFQVAEDYGHGVEQVLADIAAKGAPFQIETHGIGVTEGRQTAIYLHVTRTETLDTVHQVLLHATRQHTRNPREAYGAETWLPHIAVASGEIDEDVLSEVVAFLDRRTYDWTITATNLCLIPEMRLVDGEWLRFELQGGKTGGAAL